MCEKYNIDSSVISSWERKYRKYGFDGLKIDGRGNLGRT